MKRLLGGAAQSASLTSHGRVLIIVKSYHLKLHSRRIIYLTTFESRNLFNLSLFQKMDLNIRRDFKEAGHERQALEKNFSAELNSVVSKIEQQFSEQHGDPYDPVDTGRYPSERFETNETIGSDCSNRTSSVESWAENAEQLLQGK